MSTLLTDDRLFGRTQTVQGKGMERGANGIIHITREKLSRWLSSSYKGKEQTRPADNVTELRRILSSTFCQHLTQANTKRQILPIRPGGTRCQRTCQRLPTKNCPKTRSQQHLIFRGSTLKAYLLESGGLQNSGCVHRYACSGPRPEQQQRLVTLFRRRGVVGTHRRAESHDGGENRSSKALSYLREVLALAGAAFPLLGAGAKTTQHNFCRMMLPTRASWL